MSVINFICHEILQGSNDSDKGYTYSMHGIMKAYNQNKRSLGITRHKLEVTHKMGVCVCVCVCACACACAYACGVGPMAGSCNCENTLRVHVT